MKARLLAVIVTSLLVVNPAVTLAGQFQILGSRALGMGGAHVAAVKDSTASYWNPAAFGFFGRMSEEDEYDDKYGLVVGAHVGVQVPGELTKEVNELIALDFKELKDLVEAPGGIIGPTATDEDRARFADYIRLFEEVDDLLQKNLGVMTVTNGGVFMNFRNLGVGAVAMGEFAVTPSADLANFGAAADPLLAIASLATGAGGGDGTLEFFNQEQMDYVVAEVEQLDDWTAADATSLVYSVDFALREVGPAISSPEYVQTLIDLAESAQGTVSGDGSTLADNLTLVRLAGTAMLEIPVSYGYAFNRHIAVGGSVKYIYAVTSYITKLADALQKDETYGNMFDDRDLGEETDHNIGIDLSLLYKYDDFRAGILARNINSPKFDYKGPGDLELEPQVRVGLAFLPLEYLTLAADVDLLKNDTLLSSSYDHRLLSLGAEFDVLEFLFVRLGYMQNLEENAVGGAYTGGFGLNLLGAHLDLAAAYAPGSVEFDDYDVPEELRAELTFSLLF